MDAPRPTHVTPKVGTTVWWTNPFEGRKSGEYLGPAPGEHMGPGDPYVAVDTARGVVHLCLSALEWEGKSDA